MDLIYNNGEKTSSREQQQQTDEQHSESIYVSPVSSMVDKRQTTKNNNNQCTNNNNPVVFEYTPWTLKDSVQPSYSTSKTKLAKATKKVPQNRSLLHQIRYFVNKAKTYNSWVFPKGAFHPKYGHSFESSYVSNFHKNERIFYAEACKTNFSKLVQNKKEKVKLWKQLNIVVFSCSQNKKPIFLREIQAVSECIHFDPIDEIDMMVCSLLFFIVL